MFKAILISTLFATSAAQCLADPAPKYDLSALPPDVAARMIYLQQFGARYDSAIRATIAEWEKPGYASMPYEVDLSALPEDVAARVMALQAHGDRFKPVIRAILLEAMTPEWQFER